ncbi:hypothetical protein M2254_001214 [Chryseobacterium sp. BIGb0186]|nr:hypothetical protein [Chryseobacterium sp. JUb44]MDH6209630.1 hypothetical protein [Chryseobacterium sp. BIGb0186]
MLTLKPLINIQKKISYNKVEIKTSKILIMAENLSEVLLYGHYNNVSNMKIL